MSDVEQVAEVTAPELETTAVSPERVIEAPAEENSEKTPRVYTEEEFNLHTQKQRALYERNLAREQRKWERERQPAPAVAVDLPPQDQFESVDAYAEAKAYKLIEQRELQKQQAEILDGYHEREETARSKYSDFEQVAYNPSLKITTVMAQTIQSSDIGPDLVYHLGSNPKEADRISRLAPILQAKEIGRLEARLAENPVQKRTSGAPEPISPVTARGVGSGSFDTTDPRSIKTMTTSQWIEADRARQMKALQAKKF